MSLGCGTHPILKHLRESKAHLCPHGGLRRITMVLLPKVETMRLASSDAWELKHFKDTIYKNGATLTKKRRKVKEMDKDLVVNVDRKDLWARGPSK